jgi:putative protease
VAIDQYCRNHLLFAKDLCMLPHLGTLANASQLRIEGQHYSPAQLAIVTKIYRNEIDKLAADPANYLFNPELLSVLSTATGHELGRGCQ